MGALARRGTVSASLCSAARRGSRVDQAFAAGCGRRPDTSPGAGRMLNAVFDLARPMLFALPPEQAHEATLRSLEAGFYPRSDAPDDARLSLELWGLRFRNPLGIAAGFDKDGRV